MSKKVIKSRDLSHQLKLLYIKDEMNEEPVNREYTSNLADWSKETEKVKSYNPFYYTNRASKYPSNL